MSAPALALAPDLAAGLRRLKPARIRAIAAEVCQTAKTQRWAPEELLRTLVEAEIAARDQANLRARLKAAGFPVHKTLDEFKVQVSSVAQPTFDYLSGLEWVRARENCLCVRPAGTGKSHLLIALGHAAVEAGHRVRYFIAADLVSSWHQKRRPGVAAEGQPIPVNIHDFVTEQGKAIPYGIYDLERNVAWVDVGQDHETAALAVESIRRWWRGDGMQAYPAANQLLICADGCGANGYRVRAWKHELWRFTQESGLAVTVCHLPPGTGKWNKTSTGSSRISA